MVELLHDLDFLEERFHVLNFLFGDNFDCPGLLCLSVAAFVDDSETSGSHGVLLLFVLVFELGVVLDNHCLLLNEKSSLLIVHSLFIIL